MQISQKKGSATGAAVIAALQYFHLFKHPLYIEELHKFSNMQMSIDELHDVLDEMVAEGIIYRSGSFYMMEDRRELITKRIEGKKRADVLMEKAARSAKLVAKFPFVKSVCISGSLSKGYANEQSDIDLFIITTKQRLWICRSILHLYKKLTFLWGGQNSYCMNYFIDESALCLEEQNKFTATELATLIPLYNPTVHGQLIAQNEAWLSKMFPNICWDEQVQHHTAKRTGIRLLLEPVINLLFPQQLNLLLMNLTDKMWRMKWERKGYPMKDYDLAMKTKWYVSKNHPHNYQKSVLKELKMKLPMAAAV